MSKFIAVGTSQVAISQILNTQAEHTQILNAHTQLLDTHTQLLNEILRILRDHNGRSGFLPTSPLKGEDCSN